VKPRRVNVERMRRHVARTTLRRPRRIMETIAMKDPDAMLAALVWAGVLGKEEQGSRLSGEWLEFERYVTEWREK
jgi:hypothetical protein